MEQTRLNDLDTHWPVVVIGAGPAGALAARRIALQGTRVLLVDKAAFPRRKVCGCCLNARGLQALADAGLGDLPERLGAVPLTAMLWHIGGRSTVLPLEGGVALSRDRFDLALLDAARSAGVTVLEKTSAEPSGLTQAARLVQLRNDTGERTIEAGVVLACDGLNSRFGDSRVKPDSRIGLGTVIDSPKHYKEPGRLWMVAGAGGYVGLVRLEDGRLDIAAAVDREAVRSAGSPGRFLRALLASAGLSVPDDWETAAWQGTPPLTRSCQPAGERLLRLGDAAGYVEPFTGEGMAWALSAAVAVAPLAAREWSESVSRQWVRWYVRNITSSQRGCRLAARALRSPSAVTALVRLSTIFPGFAARVVRTLHPKRRRTA